MPHVPKVPERHVHGLADDAGVARDGRSHQVGGKLEDGIGVEAGGEALLGQLHAVALDPREADFQVIPIGAHGLDLHRLQRRLGRGDDGLGCEIKGDAEDVRVLGIEEPLLVEVVGPAAERPLDDLLAEKLGAEGADTEDVGDVVGVPPFGEHGNRDDAADVAPERAGFADGVHDLA